MGGGGGEEKSLKGTNVSCERGIGACIFTFHKLLAKIARTLIGGGLFTDLWFARRVSF